MLVIPVFSGVAGLGLTLVFAQLPMYMLHQFEEHAGDRFRQYINKRVAKGLDALKPTPTFWLNALGVWVFDVLILYLAAFADQTIGLAAVYLELLNGLGHIVQAIVLREYNPRL